MVSPDISDFAKKGHTEKSGGANTTVDVESQQHFVDYGSKHGILPLQKGNAILSLG